MREIIEKYFEDRQPRYFSAPDLIDANHYIRYQFNGNRVILHVGCDEGEIPLFLCSTPEKLEEKIKSIIY